MNFFKTTNNNINGESRDLYWKIHEISFGACYQGIKVKLIPYLTLELACSSGNNVSGIYEEFIISDIPVELGIDLNNYSGVVNGKISSLTENDESNLFGAIMVDENGDPV